MDKILSVVVPCYNVEQYVGRCIESLMNQTLDASRYEVILVDDASTDHTYDVLCEYEKKYPDNIMVIHCDVNGRQGRARNIGIQYASGEYIAFCDSDDWVEPDCFLFSCKKAMELDCDIVTNQSERVTDEHVIHKTLPGSDLHLVADTEENRRKIIEHGTGGLLGGIFRKKMIIENDIWFPEQIFYEDNFWGSIVILYANSLYQSNHVFYHYFVNNTSTTANTDINKIAERLDIELMLLDEYKKRGFWEQFQELFILNFIQRYYINSLYMFVMHCDNIPISICRDIAEVVRQTAPDYMQNQYIIKRYEQASPMIRHLLYILQKDLSNEQWRDELRLIVLFETLSKLSVYYDKSTSEEMKNFCQDEMKKCVSEIADLTEGMEEEFVNYVRKMKREITCFS